MNKEPAEMKMVLDIALQARSLSLDYFRHGVKARTKSDDSVVSDADLAVEDFLKARLEECFPGDGHHAEESGASEPSRRMWFIDAIDGSSHFVRGSSDWSTMLALVVDGDVRLAVVDQPARGVEYWASRGGGSFSRCSRNGETKQLQVRSPDESNPPRAFLPERVLEKVDPALLQHLRSGLTACQRDGNAAAQVARGGLAAALYMDVNVWDLAAPRLLVEEAGGRFSDLRGGCDLYSGGGLFSNGKTHDRILHLLATAAS